MRESLDIDYTSMKKDLEGRINQIQLPPSKPSPFEILTETESNVLELIIRGWPNLRIAKMRYNSENTIRVHLRSIYSKVGVSDGAERKSIKATILYMAYYPKSFLDSYTKEELENAELVNNLTSRELDVLRYYVLGFSYKKIGDSLKISKNTVGHHLLNVFYKLCFEEKGIYKKDIKTMRLYLLRFPEIIPSLYSQVKHFITNNDQHYSEKEINVGPLLSNIPPNLDLSSREFEVLNELTKNGSNKELAHRLFIRISTLRDHIKNINKKGNIKLPRKGTYKAKIIARRQIYTKVLESILIQRKKTVLK